MKIPTPMMQGLDGDSNIRKANKHLGRMMNLPTPRQAERCDYQNDGGDPNRPRLSLLGTIKKTKLPTPRSSENENWQLSFTPSQRIGERLLPTPTLRDKSSRGRSEANRESPALNHVVTNGKASGLNPELEEILMGWPLGWTADELDVAEFEYWRESFWNWFHLNPVLEGMNKWAAWRVHEHRYDCIADGLVRSYKGIQKRREAIGLGIVPQCMVAAWNILNI